MLGLWTREWLCEFDKRFILSRNSSLLRRTWPWISIAIYFKSYNFVNSNAFHFTHSNLYSFIRKVIINQEKNKFQA